MRGEAAFVSFFVEGLIFGDGGQFHPIFSLAVVLTELGSIVDGHATTSILHLFDGLLVLQMHPRFELNFVLHLSKLLLLRPIFSFGLGPSESIAELLPQLEDFEAGAFNLGVASRRSRRRCSRVWAAERIFCWMLSSLERRTLLMTGLMLLPLAGSVVGGLRMLAVEEGFRAVCSLGGQGLLVDCKSL